MHSLKTRLDSSKKHLHLCAERTRLFTLLVIAAREYAKAADRASKFGQLGREQPDAETAQNNVQRAYAAFLKHIADHGCWTEVHGPVEEAS